MLTEFNVDNKRLDGRYAYCRSCVKDYRKEKGIDLYAYNPESQKKRQRKFRKMHKSYERNFRKQYLHSFEGKCAKLYSGAKRRASAKGFEFNLTSDWVADKLRANKCEATGVEFNFNVPHNQKHGDFTPSVDRIDNSLGYTQDNCWIVCLMFNRAKSEGTFDNVLAMAKSMTEKYSSE